MPKVTYVDPDGAVHTFEVAVGTSVMRGAFDNSVPGILAECGGACACATCQVVIDPAWEGRIPPPELVERSMLDGAEGDEPRRRLSCQITMTPELDGLVVRVVADQH